MKTYRPSLREVLMIDFDRFWMEGNGPYEDEDLDPAEIEAPPGVTPEAITAWERAHGVRLPEPLRTALGIRNGGCVRNTTIEVLPLDEIVPVDEDFWEFTELDEDEAPDRGLLFVFGNETETGATYLLNFNARGPRGEPSVYLDHHGESTYLVHDSLGGHFEAELASSAEPSVDWSETQSALDVLARETIDLSALYGGPATEEQVLARQEGALVLFVRTRSPEGETLSRTTLPLPLDADWAKVGPHRPAPTATFALHLQPEESDGIVAQRSEANDDGAWKNSTDHGVPIYVQFESTDRDRLHALRRQLFGAEAAARAESRQDREDALRATLDALPPQERTAALLQEALRTKGETDRQFASQFGDLGPIPPELAGVAEAMRLKLEQMTERARRTIAANPPDPDLLKRIEGLLGRKDLTFRRS